MEEFIVKLVKLGLSELEARVYISLLQKNNFSATEIASITNINRTQTYDILSKLVKKGLCTEIRGNKKKYIAVDPEKVLSALEKELEKKKKIASELSSQLSEIYNGSHDNQNPLDFIEVLFTRTSIINRIESLERSSTDCVMAFNKPPYAMNIGQSDLNKISAEFRSPQQEGIAKGVKFRSLYEIEGKNSKEFIEKVKYFHAMGEEVKVAVHLPFKMFVFDKQIILLALRNQADTSVSFTTMTIDHSDFAEAMAGIFELYWQGAMSIEEYIRNCEEN